MNWLERLMAIEELEDAPLDATLVVELERAGGAAVARPIRFATPTFKDYASTELHGCSRNSFPAFSITAGACGLNCDHCRAKILEPMLPATSPEMLDRKARELIARQGLQGFLLSGGSNRRNEIRYERFYPVLERLKRDHPTLTIAIHTALTDEAGARAMEAAGVDIAMMDVIGAQATIEQVYHLERPVADFEATLAALCTTSMKVTPHIVIGLHYGIVLGEPTALEIVSQYPTDALVLVVVMPFYALPGTFAVPDPLEVGRLFAEARARLPDREVLLGCARPPGMHKRLTDAYAVLAGLDGIAFPADGAVAVAAAIGRPFEQQHACCSVKLGTLSGRPAVRACAGSTAPGAVAAGVDA
jgi:uncharacterized radical SAM superfamily protein